MKRIEAGEIGTPVVFKSIGRDKDGPPLSSYHANINGMLFYTNTIHDFDLARWLMQDEVSEVHAYTTVAIRPEVAEFGDAVASVVNLKFNQGAIGNIESHAQAAYGYDVRTEIVGSKGSILVGSLYQTPATFLTTHGSTQPLADHFLSDICGRLPGGDARLCGLYCARPSASGYRRGWAESTGHCRCGREFPLEGTADEGVTRSVLKAALSDALGRMNTSTGGLR